MSRLHAARCRHYRGKPKTLCDHDVLFGSNALIVKDPSLGARAECQCLGAVLFPSAHDLQSSLVGFPGSGLGVSRERHFLMQVADSQSLRTDLERCCDLQHSSLRIDVGSASTLVVRNRLFDLDSWSGRIAFCLRACLLLGGCGPAREVAPLTPGRSYL